MKLRSSLLILAAVVAAVSALMTPEIALAFREPWPGYPNHQTSWGNNECSGCHVNGLNLAPGYDSSDCRHCHTYSASGAFPIPDNTGNPFAFKGPHGTYSTTTDRCDMCHTLHDATGGDLLPAGTITGTCFSCHDGTGGFGVYGTIAARGRSTGASHSVDTTSVIPGGDASTGGGASRLFRGQGSRMSCSDCHSPHSHLLKRRPTAATTDTAVYGSDWCLGCHLGRVSGGTPHNHPVDSAATTVTPFYYDNLVAVSSGFIANGQTAPSSAYGIGTLGGVAMSSDHHGTASLPVNRAVPDYSQAGFLMPYPRLALQGDHKPICQQCHEDARDAGRLTVDGTGTIPPREGYRDGWNWEVDGFDPNATTSPNPRFQNFPHETENPAMLIESGDDLCLNCHPVTALP